MRQHWLPYLFLLIAVGSLGLAAYHYVGPWWNRPRFAIDKPERDLKRVMSGKEQIVHFTLNNPTRSPVRVVGMREC